MKFVDRFEYCQLEKITAKDGSRVYVTPNKERLPSVTTILSATGDKTGLEKWRERVGEIQAEKERKEAAGIGSLLHAHLEAYVMDQPRPSGSNHVRVMAKNMADVLIERGLCRVTEIWGIEEHQYYPGLYAGTADLLGCFEGAPAIMDYKTSKKMKKAEMLEDYRCQIVAYSLAHNEIYGTKIKTGAIFMIARDLSYQTFVINGIAFQKACDDWYRRLDEWYNSTS